MASNSYVTTYCNKAHNINTGKPIGHDCYTIPPKALKAEMEGRYEDAIKILEAARLSPR